MPIYNNNIERLFISAATKGDLKTIKHVIENGHITFGYVIESGINLASYNGYLEIVKYLIEYSNSIDDIIDIDKSKAIIEASAKGFPEIVKYLIEQGADITVDSHASLRYAHINNHPKVIKELRKVYITMYGNKFKCTNCIIRAMCGNMSQCKLEI